MKKMVIKRYNFASIVSRTKIGQLQNTGPLLKVYIREWLAGSAVALVLEERGRFSYFKKCCRGERRMSVVERRLHD